MMIDCYRLFGVQHARMAVGDPHAAGAHDHSQQVLPPRGGLGKVTRKPTCQKDVSFIGRILWREMRSCT